MNKEGKFDPKPQQVPEWARIRRPKPVPPAFDGAPELGDDAGKITDSPLLDAISQLEKGNFSGLRASYPRAEDIRFRRALTQCSQRHFLEEGRDEDSGNRLTWWTKHAPPTGPLSAFVPFDCVFHPALRHRVDWTLEQPQEPANGNIASQFTFLDQPPRSIPTVQRMPVTVMTGFEADSRTAGEHNVVVNAVGDGFQFDNPQQPWPPLTIVFDQSQRAVGIEYGFAGDRDISPLGVELTAYDRTGYRITVSRGGAGSLGDPPYIGPGEVFHQIGVQDWRGEIRYVVLSVTTDRAEEVDPGQPIRTPPLIYRVWHESLPPAAVTQGFTETTWSGGSTISATVHPTEHLPFRCDRAAVMLRGFRVAFLDGEAHQIRGLDIAFDVQRNGAALTIAPLFNAGLRTVESPAPARMVRLYYTVLAWDSEQVDAKAVGISGGPLAEPGYFGVARAELDQSGRFPLTQLRVPDPCGPTFCPGAFGVFTGFSVRFGERNIEDIQLAQDKAFPHSTDPVLAWPVTVAVTDTQADIFGYRWMVFGLIFTGDISGAPGLGYGSVATSGAGLSARGVSSRRQALEDDQPPDPRVRNSLNIDPAIPTTCGVRPASGPGHFLPTADQVLDAGFARAISADMAFPVLGTWHISGDNSPVREIETEIHSRRYDGAILDWEVGHGASLGPPEDQDCVFHSGAPVFGQVSSTVRSRGTLSVQHARFETVPGIVATVPTRFGVLQNLGPGPVLITSAVLGGPDQGNFWIRLGRAGQGDPVWQAAVPPALPRGNIFGLEAFFQGPPVQLLAGEVLLIGGRFYTSTAGDSHATIEFTTNAAQRNITVELHGVTIPSNAAGQWLPPRLQFGFRPIGRRSWRSALITSDGSTPLVITALRIADPQAGFSILSSRATELTGVRYQIQPGASYEVPIFFEPAVQGHFTTRITAETNAGDLVMELFGDAVPSN